MNDEIIKLGYKIYISHPLFSKGVNASEGVRETDEDKQGRRETKLGCLSDP